MRRPALRYRAATAWRWVMQPWRSLSLIVALTASFAFPAFMAASADVFRASASDSITRSVVSDDPRALDVSVRATGALTPGGVDAIEETIPERLGRFALLGEPRRTIYVPGGQQLGLQNPATIAGPATPIIGSAARFVARPGVLDGLDVIEGDRSTAGLWISERIADRLEIELGQMVSVDSSEPLPIAGIYRNLWEAEIVENSAGESGLGGVPTDLIPRFSRVLGGPTFEVIFSTEEVLLTLGVDGIVRWDAPVDQPPTRFEQLAVHDARVRGLERSFTESGPVVSALAQFAGPGARVPDVVTDTSRTRSTVDDLVAELEQPIQTAALGGIALGLLVTAAGAGFAVRRRATEVRLLRADGDAGWRFALRAVAQFTLPAVLGGAIGVGAAALTSSSFGDGVAARTDVIEMRPVVISVLIGLVVAALVTAGLAIRSLDTKQSSFGTLRAAWLLPVVGVAIAAWVQVGATNDQRDVDPLVLAFPMVGLVAGVGVGVIGVRWLMQRMHRRGRRLPPALFLAWRRVSSAEPGAVLASSAMGIALGLIVFSSTLVGALSTAAEAKSTAAVGGRVQVPLSRLTLENVPEQSTVARLANLRLTIGNQTIQVVAIDPTTYASGVSWNDKFGGSAQALLAALERPVDADLAAVVVGELAVPESSGFGSSEVFTFEVVDRLAGAPLASDVYPTIVVSAAQVDAAGLANHRLRRPPDIDSEPWDAGFRSPLLDYRQRLISQLDVDSVIDFIDDNDLGIDSDELVTLTGQRSAIDNQAARWSFDYLGLLAAVAGLAAVGTLFFYLSERRAARELSTVMAARMGLRRSTAAVAAVIELVSLVLVAFVIGAATALVLAARVFDRFEPATRQPPAVGLSIDVPQLLTIAGGALVLVVAAALITQRSADRRSYSEVLRGS